MSSKNLLIYVGLFGAATPLLGQQSAYFNDRLEYRTTLAEQLYRDKIYAASQYEFARQYFYLDVDAAQKEAALFYDNVIGVILGQNHAEEGLEAFTKEHPNSAYFAVAHGPLADYYITKKNFRKALEELQQVNQYHLTREENTQYILKLGYTKFMLGDNEGAMRALQAGYKTTTGEEKNDIAYMLGHLEYAKGDSQKAFEYFDTIRYLPKYSKTLRPYYLQMYFNNGEYDKAIAEGKSLLQTDISDDFAAEVHKIIGESYFMQQNYSAAYPHLQAYLQSHNGEVSENDLYEIGYVAAKLKRYDEAVGYYNQLVSTQSPLAQNAYYQLGNAYLEVGKKKEALAAFRSAAHMEYTPKISRLAHVQYAKLGYDIGDPFESNAKVIQDYIKKYPNADNIAAMKQLLVKSYLYSGNFEATLSALDNVPNKSPELKKIEQEVAFMLGSEEYNKGNFQKAEKLFQKSLTYNYNKEFTPRAKYWLGLSQYQLGDYKSSIATLQVLYNAKANFKEQQQLPYDLAYAYFKNKEFAKAQHYYQEYLKNPKATFKADAQLRLADTHYANNELKDAIALYDKVDEVDDYTLFQKALALGYQGKSSDKINTLKALIQQHKNSEYLDDAQYEMGATYAKRGDYTTANDYFNRVIKSSSDSDLVAKASIFEARNYVGMGNAKKALDELAKLGEYYRGTTYADKVVAASKEIYLKEGDVAGYRQFAENLGVNISASEIDQLNLTTAQRYYTDKNYTKAIAYYEKFLLQKPTGEKYFQAKYELGNSYYQTKNLTKALLILQAVAQQPNAYRESAQVRIAQIYLARKKPAEAKKYLAQLISSEQVNIKNYALQEMMELSVEAGQYKEAEQYADLIIANAKNSKSVIEQAKVIKARSLMKQGKSAREAYRALEQSSNPSVAAEALYAKAYYQNKAKDFKASNETIFKIANNYAAEQYWGAKALVVMAKNYWALGDKYQASYTVDQLIANYQDFPDVVAEAKAVKSQIK